jgi:glycosyltransferase involved in cell wall biosynthesis
MARPRTIGIDFRPALGQSAGVGRYVRNLVRHMLDLEVEEHFVLFVDRRGEEDALPLDRPNVSRRTLTLPAGQNYFTWLQLRLPPSLWRRPVDLFHFPFYTMPLLSVGPAVVTIHDLTFELHPEWFSRRSRVSTRRFARFAARHATAILTVSHWSKKDLVEIYGLDPERVHVIYPAVGEWNDQGGEMPQGPVAARLGVAGPFVLHVGSIHTRRNLPRLLRAVARLRGAGEDLSVVLVGKVEYPYPDVHEMIREAGMAGAAVHAGYLPDGDLRALVQEAQLMAVPSLYEGFGLPGVEAMALGTPVVASNTSCFPEVLGDGALLVDPLDEEALADAIRRAATEGGERDALRARGRARAARYSWRRTAQETLAVYRAVLEAAS